MKRYDRYEDGIVIDKMSGENNLLDLVRVGDCIELKNNYIYSTDDYDLAHINEIIKLVAIWFRSGDTMKRYEVK